MEKKSLWIAPDIHDLDISMTALNDKPGNIYDMTIYDGCDPLGDWNSGS